MVSTFVTLYHLRLKSEFDLNWMLHAFGIVSYLVLSGESRERSSDKSIHATLVDLNYITVCMVSILGHHAIFFVGLFVASGRTIIIIEQERSVSIK